MTSEITGDAALSDRAVPRWRRAPGWDSLFDRADLIVKAHQAAANHPVRFHFKSKGGIDTWGDCCKELDDQLYNEVEEPSNRTCALCGAPGREYDFYNISCAEHAYMSWEDFSSLSAE